MDLRFSRELEAFRDEVRTFLDGALDDELRRGAAYSGGMFQDYETNIRWHRILAAKGWVAPAWPERFGGPGWSVEQRYIFSAECAAAGAPALAPMGLGMCGPVLMGHGTEEQQATFLPRILSGEDYWCQGYSEPGSGSDLAALALDARRDGDHYVLNGSKIWTTHAHHANWMFALVRTDRSSKPQTGITFLLIPMDTPGLRVDPIIFVSGEHEVNAVFFDDVRVPVSHRVPQGPNGRREIPVKSFVTGPFQNVLAHNEIAIEAVVPAPRGEARGAYLKRGRRVGDFATAAVAVALDMSGDMVLRAGIALTGVGGTTIDASEAAESLTGSTLDADSIARAAELAAAAAQPRSDHRGSASYKRHIVNTFTARALSGIASSNERAA